MSFSSYLSTIYAETLPDWAALGRRLFFADGRNPNWVHDGNAVNDRIMGCYPQVAELEPELQTGTGLTANTTYAYAVQRVVKVGNLEVPSAAQTAEITTGAAGEGALLQCAVTLTDYEFPAPAGAGWELYYRVYRSKPGALDLVYRIGADLDQAAFEALEDGVFVDDTPDADLDESVALDLETEEPNQFVPPVRYLRAYLGRLLAGGSYAYRTGSVTVAAEALDVVTVADGVLHAADVGAYLLVDGEAAALVVAAVDVAAGTLTLANACTMAHAAGTAYALFREYDTLYVLNPLPDNIEGYAVSGLVYSGRGDNSQIAGLAVNGSHAYVLRRNGVELVEGSGTTWGLIPHPGAPAGCVSHATIADRYSPYLLYYAGQAGVWLCDGNSARCISEPVRAVLETEVDHTQDAWTHGVYDPQTGYYWLWLFGTDWADAGVRIPQLVLIWDSRRSDLEKGVYQWYCAELAAMRSDVWRDADGKLVPVIGVAGGVARLDVGDADGAAYDGTVTGATATTLADSGAALPCDGAGLAGMPVHVENEAGVVQRRLVKANTATGLEIYGEWASVPKAGWTYRIGAMRWHATTAELGYAGRFGTQKLLRSVQVAAEQDTVAHTARLTVRGARAKASRAITKALDLGAREVHKFAGAECGLRARCFQVTVSGDTARPVVVLAVKVEDAETKETGDE